jgi:hypothetical protein
VVEVLGGVAGDTENRRQHREQEAALGSAKGEAVWRGGGGSVEVGEAKGDDTKEGKERGRSQNVIDRDRSGMRMRSGTVSTRVGPAGMRERVRMGWVTK